MAAARIVVVGAGLAGLSAACHLRAAGHDVVLCDRAEAPGGRLGRLERDGYRFDTGATVMTMPDLLDEPFAALGESRAERLELLPVDPYYRAVFADGSHLDVVAGAEAMREEIRRFAGPAEADGFDRLRVHLRRMYEVEMPNFLDLPVEGITTMLRKPIPFAQTVRLGGMRRLHTLIAGFFDDDRLRRVFSFQGLYAGVSPFQALGMLAVITYMDTIAGVSYPAGGMHEMPTALATLLAEKGVDVRLGAAGAVARVDVDGPRRGRAVARGVVLATGERIAADAVVVTGDLPRMYGSVLPAAWRPRRLDRARYSPSGLLVLAGADRTWPEARHHTIRFGETYRRATDDVVEGRDSRDEDVSILITNASHTDPAAAPDGATSLNVLWPCANLRGDGLTWPHDTERTHDRLLAAAETAGYPGLRDAIVVEETVTPQDWSDRGMEAGTPFSLAHTFGQSAAFRPGHRSRDAASLYFAGSANPPGVGVPMVLMSGKHVAALVTRDLAARRRRAPAPDSPSPLPSIEKDPIAELIGRSDAEPVDDIDRYLYG